MAYTTFAAIDVGSYEIGMKIFELSKNRGMREIDSIRHRLELGREAYTTGKISMEKVENLCQLLMSYKTIMEGYQVDDYRACATSAIRETRNCLLILDKIRVRTGLEVEVLSNSEHRFLGYKSIASNEESFQKIIQNPIIKPHTDRSMSRPAIIVVVVNGSVSYFIAFFTRKFSRKKQMQG